MRKFSFLFVLVCLMLTACGQNTQASWQEQYDFGIRYLSEGNYEEAIIAFTAAIEIDPKRAEAYIGRGDAYVGSGETEDNLAAALADYEAALELDDTIVYAWVALGNIHTELGSYECAISAYAQSLELDSMQVDVYLRIAECYAELGDLSAAIDILETGIDKTGDETLRNQLQKYKDQFMPSEITVLKKQSYTKYDYIGRGEYGDDQEYSESYSIFEYNEAGYMVHTEHWDRDNAQSSSTSGEWVMTSSNDVVYDQDLKQWVNRQYSRHSGETESALHDYYIGTYAHYLLGSDGEVCITCDPYPEETSDIVYNSEYNDNDFYDYDWYSAQYTYDAAGNAVRIESYSIDGELLGICELEYEVLKLK